MSKTNAFNAWRGVDSRKTLVRAALEWQQHAACVGEPLDLFFPDGARQEADTDLRARALCHGCPVKDECLDYSIAQPERYGRWGGLNETERAYERRRRMRKGEMPGKRAAVKRLRAKKITPRHLLKDATGTARRLRAATAAGRTLKSFSGLSGVPETTLSKLRSGVATLVDPDTAIAVAAAYPRVLDLEDQVFRVSLQTAAERGWAGPHAWTEATIDDPDARPYTRQAA